MIARLRPIVRKAWLLGASALFALAGALPGRAESLEDALTAVYDSSPTLNAERAHLRATDEELAKAQSGYRPQIGLSADLGESNSISRVKPPVNSDGSMVSPGEIQQNEASFKRYDGISRPGGMTLTLAQPLFDGFQTLSKVKGADARIRAGREALRDAEQRALLEAVRVYMDVLRDSSTVTLRQNSLRLLDSEARATQERLAAGATTRTDLAQAHAREAEARANLEGAKAQLRGSLANFERIVGHIPTRLTEPRGLERLLPARVEDAVAEAEGRNPQVLQSAYNEKVAAYSIEQTMGELLPQVTLQAQHTERFDPSTVLYQQSTESASVRVSIPIYQGGDVEARVRQAKQQRQGDIQLIEGARELARAQAIESFAQIQATRAQVIAVRQQVLAATEGLAGTREEQKAGQRTLLDVLNAEQELTNAKISAVNARHDLVVAAYTLLASMGRLTASGLQLGVPLYDEQKHYADTNGKWAGIAIDREPERAVRGNDWATAVQAGQ